MYTVLVLIAAIAVMIVAISKFKIHPFLAMLGVAIIMAFVVGLSMEEVIAAIEQGFSSIIATIGLVIIFGTLLGSLLEKTGAAVKIADCVVKAVGDKHPRIAMAIIGWIVSIPVFCDSGYILLNPIRKALGRKTGAGAVGMTLALAGGLFASHVFIPPTPGPIAAAGMVGMEDHLLMIMGLGAVVSIFGLAPVLLFARRLEKTASTTAEDETEAYSELLESYGKLPSAFMSFLPILLPIVLMALATTVPLLGLSEEVAGILKFFGKPMIALMVGFLSALPLLKGRGIDFQKMTAETLKDAGGIIFITAAGGVLGKVIASTDLIPAISSQGGWLTSLGLVFPFLIAALIKTAQGSSTVAMTTTASLMGAFTAGDSLMEAMGLVTPGMATLALLSIGAGALTVSHANDSYFWVVTSMSGLTPEQGYRTQTLSSLFMGLGSLAGILLLSLVVG